MKRAMVGLAWLFLILATAGASEVGFIEDFSLAKDRGVSLRQLIPGTEDYYYYHCLHYLNTEQHEKTVEMTRPWLERFGQTQRLTEIQTRQALVTYEKNPQRSLEYLRHRLGLRFDHERERLGEAPNLPTTLDPKLIARERLRADSFTRWRNLDNFEDVALDWLAAENLDWERRRHLLQRLQRPDVPNLPRLVADDLAAPHPQEFGAYPIHQQMTLAQLEEVLRIKPALLNQTAFIKTWISKLHPGADEDWRRDPALARAYFDRLLGFVRRLAPAHNSLKAHVLYHRLALERAQGNYDHDLFVEYLKLPRQQHYMAKRLLEAPDSQRFPADLNAHFENDTLLSTIGSDEALVRDYLHHFFVAADSPSEFNPYINDVYLRHLFAETKITHGLGEPEQWASHLPPELFRQLKDRVNIDFAPTNKTYFSAEEQVRLDLQVKNVPTLLVKVFEINTRQYYQTHRREVDTDINLDGLIANAETTHTYSEAPLRRMDRRFEFPQLSKPGVYVVDFIGGGKSSRALIRKGRLRPLVSVGTAGQVVSVVDDANRPVKDATLWLGGQEYSADKDGTILVPFSTNPGRQPIVISHGDFACLEYLTHQGENFSLAAGIHIDRESLLPQRIAAVVVRPGLYLNGELVSLKLLEEVRLRITATDLDGIATSTEVLNFKLYEDRESVHEFRVPSRLASLQVMLQGKVKSMSQNKSIDLAAANNFTLNGIDKTDKIEDLHLAKFGTDYVIEVLGRTGEAKQDRPVHLALKHREFKEPVQVVLKTDAQGRVRLGTLPDIVQVTATGPEQTVHTWHLPTDLHTYQQVVHARAGDTVTLPYVGSAGQPMREEFGLFEMRGGVIQTDRFEAMGIKDGSLELRGLPPGDFDLWLKRSGERIRVRVVEGMLEGSHVLGKFRQVELPKLKPVQVAAINAENEFITVRLKDASPFARVHVFATRYELEYSAFADLGRVRESGLSWAYPTNAESVYLVGRNIGDEYRYILDRRQQKKFPGNMLERPALLLNPWAVRTTETGEQMPEGGEDFRPGGVPKPAESGRGTAQLLSDASGKLLAVSPNLDYLADASTVLTNLVPDKEGIVRVSRKEIGAHSMIHVVAVDPISTTYRSFTLPEQPTKFLDLRLHTGLDPKNHFTQQKQVSVLSTGQTFTLDDLAASRFEAYDSMPKVYALYATLSRDPKLAEFSFVLTWPTLSAEAKRALYSKYACHELHFFLAKKDPAFFNSVVKPYLANKKDKTFLDHWLLEDDLSEYLQPWQYARLNTVERILLAQRLPGEQAKTARHLNDLFRLQPPNLERLQMLFDTAVKSGELGKDDALRVEKAKLRFQQSVEIQPTLPPVEMPPATPGGGGGGMGGRPNLMSPSPNTPAKNGKPVLDSLEKKAEADKESGHKKDAPAQRRSMGREEAYFKSDRDRKQAEQLYRRVDQTQEWAENNYYHLPIAQQRENLVTVNSFWLDYAKHEGKGPFFSRNVAEASRNFSEMMFALSVLELPFDAGKHTVKFDGGKMTYTPASPVIVFHEEVRGVPAPAGKMPILVSQNFYRHGDRYREENGERLDKFLTGEFVAHTVYGCQVVVTNPTPSRQKLAVLLQIPVGALPLANAQPTRTVLIDLEPYRTQTLDYLFYFPIAGRFAHFPIHVAKNENLVASAAAFAFDVVAKPTKLDTESWAYVSQFGSNEEVLAMLGRENLHALDLEKIAFRMKDRAFFEMVTQLLQSRHAFQPTLWSYGLYHNHVPVARQFLLHADNIVAECGGPITSPLLTIDPVARHWFEHLEYKPLVNARAHSLGKRRQIVNGRLNEQYHHFLKLLSYHPQLTDDDQMGVTYYLLLQDRIEEALAAFAQVNPEKVATKMQYEYLAAYLQMFGDEPQRARGIAAKYAQHPVDRWRNAFTAILQQLDEIEGKGPKVTDNDDRNQRQTQLASKEPGFEFVLAEKTVNLTWQNLEAVRVNYYLMDVELLFSRNPFVQQSGGQFAAIRPNATQDVKLPAGQNKFAFTLPENLARRNVLVEITAGGKTRTLPYYANAMHVQMNENYGQLRVSDAASGKALPKVYVKTYVRLADGQVKFHKDGYTDHRGRFDYASVSTPERAPAQRFAILILSDERGAQIKEVSPPQQ